jgi:hypothetical protein
LDRALYVIGLTAVVALLVGGVTALFMMRRGYRMPPNVIWLVAASGVALLLIGAVVAFTPSPSLVLAVAGALGALALLVYWFRAREYMEAQMPGSSTLLLMVVAISLTLGIVSVLVLR